MDDRLEHLTAGMPIVYGGNRVTSVPEALAAAFRPGDQLVVVQRTGDLLHIPAAEHRLVEEAVAAAAAAFGELRSRSDEQITRFFARFGELLADDGAFAAIAAANASDVADARSRGRSTTRLELGPKMRRDMIDGLAVWRDQPGGRDDLVRTIEHDGWRIEERRAPLGVVGFVFEGRPNVFADATGVLRTGNTVVFRIGSDALRTAGAIMSAAVRPGTRRCRTAGRRGVAARHAVACRRAGRCSPIRRWRWRWPAAVGRPSNSSAAWPGRPASR